MFKRIVIFSLASVIVLSSLGLVLAEPNGNYRKGKYLFRKSCRSCHMDGGSVMVLEPATFTQSEWELTFTPAKAEAYSCKPEWDKLSPKDIKDIFTYMYKFAKDSPTPAKCS